MADATTISVLIKARDEASAQLKKVEGNMGRLSESFSKHRRGIGMAATGIGAAITGIATISLKSSLDQQIGIDQLDVALKNVGTSYEANKKQIEDLASAQQAKTNFGDEEQRKALQKLVQVTGDYDLSMQAMIPLMDMSAATGMKLEGASVLVARAISGEESALKRYGIALETGAGPQAVLTALMEKFAGQAEAAADPTTQLKNRVGDLMQVFGDMLLPIMTEMLPKIELFIRKVIEWAEEHPTLTKVIGLSAAALGGVLLIVGPLLLILPTLATAFGLLSVAMGPITLITVGIAAAIAAAIIIYRKWDDWNREVKVGVVLLSVAIAAIFGPIGLLTAAVAAAILVWKNWDKVVGFMRKAVADFAVQTISWIRKLTEGVKTLAGWVPGLGRVEDALQDGINKLEDMESSIDQWSVSSEDRLRDQAQAWGAMEDSHHSTAGAVADNVQLMAREHEKMADKVADSVKDIDMSYGSFEDSVARAQGIVIESLDSIIAKQEALEMSQDDSYARIRSNLDETNIKWKESHLGMEDVVSRWAESTNQSTDDVLDHWDDIDLDLKDLKKVFALFTEATGQDIFTWEGKVKSATDTVSSNFRSVESNMTLIASGIHQTLIGTASETLRIAKGIHDTIAGIHRDASRSVPAPRVGGYTAPPRFAPAATAGPAGAITTAPRTTSAAFAAASPTIQAAVAAGFGNLAAYQASLKMANGGIVRQPTLAMIGESGPEAVVPLGKGGGMGTVNNFNFHGAVYGVEQLKEVVVEAVRDHAISGGFSGVFAEA